MTPRRPTEPAVTPQLRVRAQQLHTDCTNLASRLEAVPRRVVLEHLRDLAQVAMELINIADGNGEAKPPHAPIDILPYRRGGMVTRRK